ncbi:hypothetical protein FHS43_001919 [Streptosporangium becharense]|uniref:DUF3500 domain-containing protein n=1 Tax=Streptosporangium becharense TaxID=1816182 RepID=A0A7W9IBH1_9ACTN|nr:DUF3500 domain-containing protein [Streptosporangium becharense]MBB2910656.1 hypothetical protein [Streptosporangium becharense]MBB5817351.1 hypothetical protein [Streptosporangium becharense]
MSGDEATLHHAPAHRPVDGDFNVTLVTFAAMALFDQFDAEQRARVVVPFDDDNRRHWNFLPESGRRGVPLRDMTNAQRYLAHRLIAQCMSVEGYAKAVQVMSLEHVLRELNAPVFGHVAAHFRDPEGYFLTFFGQPQPDSDWGWRLVGHHLSLNFTVAGQDRLAATPLLLGSEPAGIGPFRILGEEEDLGFSLLAALDPAQVERATIHPVPPPDFATRCVPVIGEEEWPDVHGVGRRDAMITDADRRALRYVRGNPRGLARTRMNPAQQRAFDLLVEAFLNRLKPDQAGREMDRIRKAGHDELHFVWAGAHDIARPHYFRIEGPVTLIEFDNTEDDADHVHCVWRDPGNDFGADILAEHRAAQHGPAPETSGDE